MLIKMQRSKAHTDYLIFDSLSNINYETAMVTTDPLKFLESNPNSSIWTSGKTKHYNQISFCQKDGLRGAILFDGEAYICNDDGKTIQRLHATMDDMGAPPGLGNPI